jgi:hypothetical protein
VLEQASVSRSLVTANRTFKKHIPAIYLNSCHLGENPSSFFPSSLSGFYVVVALSSADSDYSE